MDPNQNNTKIAIIDDDPLILNEFETIIDNEEGMECVLAVSSLGAFFEKLSTEAMPSIILLDINLQGVNSLEQIYKIKALLPEVKIIITTGYPEYLIQSLKKGVDGYLLKGSSSQKIVEVIQLTLKGGSYIDPQLAPQVIKIFRENKSIKTSQQGLREQLDHLSFELHRREIEVVQGLIKGFTYKEIAQHNNISINTVRHYVRTTYQKFGVSSRRQLMDKLKGIH